MISTLRYFFIIYLAIIPFSKATDSLIVDLKKIHFRTEYINIEKMKFNTDISRFEDNSGNVLIVRQDSVDEPLARKLLKNKLVQLKLSFNAQTAPYPGMFTKVQACKKPKFFPKKIEQNKTSLYWFVETPAAQDFSMGNCGAKKELYFAHYLVLYCKKTRTMFDIRFYKAKQKNNRFIGKPIASCYN